MTSDTESADTGRAWRSFRDEILSREDYRSGCSELDAAIHRWSRGWPDDVASAWCNDVGCSSATVWLISHRRSGGMNTGTTLVHVPNCHGVTWPPCHLSLRHVAALIRALEATLFPLSRPLNVRERSCDIVRVRKDLTVWCSRGADGAARLATVGFAPRVAHSRRAPDEAWNCFELYQEHTDELILALKRTLPPSPRDWTDEPPVPKRG